MNPNSPIVEKSKFPFQTDESTVIDNKAILLAYVRFINEQKKKEITEDQILIFTDQLKTDIESTFSFEAVDKLDNSLQTEFQDLKYDCEAKIFF